MDEREHQARRGLRRQLEEALQDLAEAGAIPRAGEREIRIRFKGDDHVAWLEAWRVRMPASELDAAASG